MKPLPYEDLELILEHTMPLWEKLRGRRVFLSGSTGFFGAWLLESLVFCSRKLDLRLSATALTRNPELFARRMPHLAREKSIDLLAGDVRNFCLPPGKFDFIVHGAAPTSSSAASQPLELLNTLVDGTDHMLKFARTAGVSRFLIVSSGAVYGPQPPHISHIPENYLGGPDWLDPNSAYAEGKRVAEQLCALHALETSLTVAIARCFAFVGAHLPLNQHFAIGNFIGDALAGRDIQIRGDGTPMRSYLYAADLAIWLWTMLLREPGQGDRTQVFNVGSGEGISIGDLARAVADELAPSLKIHIARLPDPCASPQQYVPDVSKAENALQLKQLVGLRAAIRRTAEWYS